MRSSWLSVCVAVGVLSSLGAWAASTGAGYEPAADAITLPTSAGLHQLSDSERSAVQRLIEREVRLAREGGVTGFAGTFVSRRRADETRASGLDKLSESERGQLNRFVAQRLAESATPSFIEPRPSSAGEATESIRHRAQWRSIVTLAYGLNSRGGSAWGGAFQTQYVDRDRGFAFGLGYAHARYEGAGWECGYRSRDALNSPLRHPWQAPLE